MSAPIEDDGFGSPLRYAPPWARRAAPDTAGDPERAPALSPAADEPAPGSPEATAEERLIGSVVFGDPVRPEPRDDELAAPRAVPHTAEPPQAVSEPAAEPPTDLGPDPRSDPGSDPGAEPAAGTPAVRSAARLPATLLRAPRGEPPRIDDSPAMVPSPGDPGGFGWLRPRPFEGDVAMQELTRRLALDPHGVPEPPRPERLRVPWRGAAFLAALSGAAAAVALALVLVLFPNAGSIPRGEAGSGPVLASAKSDRALMAGLERAAPVRLVLVELRRATRGEEVALGVTLTRGLGEGTLAVSGLVPGSRLSVGMPSGPDGWRVPLGELGRAAVVPPRGFVGTMDLGLELRLADDSVGDRGTVRIEWGGATITPVGADAAVATLVSTASAASTPGLRGTTSAPARAEPVAPAVDPEEVAILLDRGKAFLVRGDLAAARLLLRRAAEAGDAQAALLLGSTFDPAALKQLEVVGAVGDPVQARQWYQRAAELGSADAGRRIESLSRAAR